MIVKVSKLTRATKVFRGVAGGVLPASFWEENKQGVRGGVESAFMSTTFDRAVSAVPKAARASCVARDYGELSWMAPASERNMHP